MGEVCTRDTCECGAAKNGFELSGGKRKPQTQCEGCGALSLPESGERAWCEPNPTYRTEDGVTASWCTTATLWSQSRAVSNVPGHQTMLIVHHPGTMTL